MIWLEDDRIRPSYALPQMSNSFPANFLHLQEAEQRRERRADLVGTGRKHLIFSSIAA
jgi:hypothetical protein